MALSSSQGAGVAGFPISALGVPTPVNLTPGRTAAEDGPTCTPTQVWEGPQVVEAIRPEILGFENLPHLP